MRQCILVFLPVLHTSPVRLLACTAPLGLSLDSGFHQSEDGGLSKQPAACHFSGSGLGFSIDDGLIHVGKDLDMIFNCGVFVFQGRAMEIRIMQIRVLIDKF